MCMHVEARWLASGNFLHTFLLVSLELTNSASVASQLATLFSISRTVDKLPHSPALYIGAGDPSQSFHEHGKHSPVMKSFYSYTMVMQCIFYSLSR